MKKSVHTLLFSLALVGTGYLLGRQERPIVISPLPIKITPSASLPILFAKKKDPADLQKRVQETIGDQWKNYSVYVKDLASDFEMGVNDRVIYEAASVNKLAILAALYHEVQQGKADLDKQVTIQSEDMQGYGSGTLRYEEPGNAYSVKTLARLMMQQSDNTAAYILSAYIVPLDTIQQLVNSWGLTQTDMVNNKTSNRDMAILLTKITNGTIANPAHTQEMRAFLKESAFEDRLPTLLRKTATVYHKTGDAVGSLHDVGVVEDGNVHYYIGILTSDVTDENQAKQLMGKLSKIVYDYIRR
ncbi:serine hydrolase [Candidatus Gottesmanbacteria bacterium]|nr:serine hydrolase [Candidatus Gottesmanbacteria bacterium]